MLRALEIDQANADIYGQLGIIYYKSRNFEGSILALKCAVRGCTPEESCDARGGCGEAEQGVQVTGLPLSPNTVAYYYEYVEGLALLTNPPLSNYCPEASQPAAELRIQTYGSDPVVKAVVNAVLQDYEDICASLEEGATPVVSTPSQITPEP